MRRLEQNKFNFLCGEFITRCPEFMHLQYFTIIKETFSVTQRGVLRGENPSLCDEEPHTGRQNRIQNYK